MNKLKNAKTKILKQIDEMHKNTDGLKFDALAQILVQLDSESLKAMRHSMKANEIGQSIDDKIKDL